FLRALATPISRLSTPSLHAALPLSPDISFPASISPTIHCFRDDFSLIQTLNFPVWADRISMKYQLTAQFRMSQTTNETGFTVCRDRKSTRLNSSHVKMSYAVFCLKK